MFFRQLISNLKELVIYKTYELDNQTVTAGATKAFNVPVPIIEGYARGTYVISIINATSNGANSSYCFAYQSVFDDDTVLVSIRNTGSANAKIKIRINISYYAGHIVK